MSAGAVRDFLARHGLAANRDLGQSFLVDPSLAARLVMLSAVEPEDAVIEIGTGLGVMTRALAERVRRVVTLEIDAGLVRALRAEATLPGNVELRHVDALDVDLLALATELGTHVRVVGNLPYAISSPLLRRLLDARHRLRGWSVMLQRELATRLVADPGSRDYGSLGVLHHLTVSVQREMDLRPGCFFPVPRVQSSFLRMTPRGDEALDAVALADVERVVRAAFGARRKTLANALRAGLAGSADAGRIAAAMAAADLAPGVRAERVEPARFVALTRALALEGQVEPGEVLDCLVDLARELGLEVKRLPSHPASESEPPPRSGACRLRGRLLVLLAPGDSVEDRIEALVQGLRGADRQLLEGRWLPPAVRERLEAEGRA